MVNKKKDVNLKELNAEELSRRLSTTQEELFKLRFRAASSPLKNPMRIQKARREIARLNTFINQRRKADARG